MSMREFARYRQLDQGQISQTLWRLRDRIAERFPGSGLSKVAGELVSLSDEAFDCVAYLRKPNWPIRVAVGVVIAAMVVVVGLGALSIRVSRQVSSVSELVQTLDASINDVVFLGIAIFFLVTLEARLKRRKALGSLQQLRSVVHIVDMHQLTKDPERLMSPHQLTKDPERLMSPQPDTSSSPERSMTGPELGRYLDYCSEMLSLTSKIAASFVQSFNDPVLLSTVNEIETLVTGLSGKIWQKITLLERATRSDEMRADAFGRSPSLLPQSPTS
jgi:hypothetical protein